MRVCVRVVGYDVMVLHQSLLHTVAERALDPLAWCLAAVLLLIPEREGVKMDTLGVSCFLLGAHHSLWPSL